MKSLRFIALLFASSLIAGSIHAESWIVRDSQPKAGIVIAENPPRMAGLAALELQHYLEKIGGARLPIAREPSNDWQVKIYVGKSRFTDALGVTDKGLNYGACRMVSGNGWLVLLGLDRDYMPPEPGKPSKLRWSSGKVLLERYGDDFRKVFDPQAKLQPNAIPDVGLWLYDADGSLNAVNRYLMTLGVRWFMPGKLGEVIPQQKTIALAAMDKTLLPDFTLRTFNWSGFNGQPFEHMMWGRRLGMTSVYDVLGRFTWAHNLTKVYNRPEMKQAHPEYFALRGGKRELEAREPSACFSAEGLVRDTVAYGRSVFASGAPAVDLWPEDGYRQCECDLCKGKTPSELVFGFVDKVARQLYQSHPDRLVMCASYTPYNEPPATISKFTPNVCVMFASGAGWELDQPDKLATFLEKVGRWTERTAPGHILRWENNFAGQNPSLRFPVIHPRARAAELKALKGISMGEFHNCQPGSSRPGFPNPGLTHLTLYALGQYLWDADQDINAFMEEYYTLFYGPAREQMKTALEYAQASYCRDFDLLQRLKRLKQKRPNDPELKTHSDSETALKIRFVELLHVARAKAGDSIYGERIQLLIDEMPPLETLRIQAKAEAEAPNPRANAPELLGLDGPGPDGAQTYRLKNLVARDEPKVQTAVRIWWEQEALCLEFDCKEPDMKNLFSSTQVHDGDSVVILIETPAFSYYHIEISPEGKVFERAVKPLSGMSDWSAQAEVKTERGADFWRVRARLPVSGKDGLAKNPRHLIAGAKPDKANPWFVNFGRSRVRGASVSNFSFSPTGKGSYHVPEKFAKLEIIGKDDAGGKGAR